MPSDPLPPNDFYADLLGLRAPAPAVAPEALEVELAAALEGEGEDLAWRLHEAGLRDLKAALAAVRSLAEDAMARDRFIGVLARLLAALPQCADPDMALRNLDRFARASLDRVSLYGALLDHPALVRFLADLLSFSEFLSDILIRNPEYFEWLLTA